MYLSDNDLRKAIKAKRLIVNPVGTIGANAIDVHLDSVDQARIWDTEQLKADNKERGLPGLQLNVARMDYGAIALKYQVAPPREKDAPAGAKVVRRDDCIVVKPGGFVLWQTREIIGTPEIKPLFICFIDGKSTRARTGLVVHLTAPTIHAGWSGNVTLEMTNCGPLELVLNEGDAVAQIIVAQLTQPPSFKATHYKSATHKQTTVAGTKKARPSS